MKIEDVKATSGAYLSRLAREFFAANVVWLLLPVLSLSGVAAWLRDARWLIVALMVLFVAIPMLLSLCYINYALSAEARWSLMQKDITVTPDGLLLHFADTRMREHLIAWREVKRVAADEDYLVLTLRVRRYTFLLIPHSSITDPSVVVAIGKRVAQGVE